MCVPYIIIIIILFAREQYSKQVQMTVEMSRTIRRKDTHLQMPFSAEYCAAPVHYAAVMKRFADALTISQY